MKVQIYREVIIWIISFIVGAIVWSPIFLKIPYAHTALGIFSIVIMIQFFRWFVFYDNVIFFRTKIGILLSIFISFAIGAIVWSKGQEIMLIAENQVIEDIMILHAPKVSLGLEETYKLFEYLRNLLAFCNFGTPVLAFMMILKIIYKTIGMGSKKVKTYLGK